MSKISNHFVRFYRSYSRAPLSVTSFIANKPQTPKIYVPSLLHRNNYSSATRSLLADKELVSFLTEEIENEKRSLNNKDNIVKFDGYETEITEAKVILKKTLGKEKIKIIFNVNNSLETNDNYEDQEQPNNSNNAEYDSAPVSKPTYTIEIEKNGEVLAFYCSFIEDGGYEVDEKGSPDHPSYSDLFRVDEISQYKGEYSDNCYSVSCELLDEQMYERLFNMLEERGLGNDFASKIAEFSTLYEHKLYVDLLAKIKHFISS